MADTKNKIVEDLTPARRMRDFGMKLHAEEASRRIGESLRWANCAVCQTLQPFWKGRHLVAVAPSKPAIVLFAETV